MFQSYRIGLDMPQNMTEGSISKAAREAVSGKVRKELSDATCPGLRVRLAPTGVKTWALHYRDRELNMRREVLGEYPQMGISEARAAARKLHVEIKSGGADPAKERQRFRIIGKNAKEGIGTLKALLDVYEGKGKPGSKLKSWKQGRHAIENVFEKHLSRPLATMTAAELQITADAHKAEYSASLAVRCLRPILDWASVSSRGYAPRGLIEIHPPATVQRRERVLTADELRALLPALRASTRPYAAAMRFMLLTLARREEVGSACWRRVDLDAGTWTIPETKNGEPHIVPLSKQAIDLLRSRLPTNDDGRVVKPDPDAFIFATSTGATLGNWDRETKVIQEASGIKDWTRHDLRRTGATRLGEMGELPDIIEAALNHVSIHSRLAATYNRSRYRPQVAAALQRLADALDLIEAGGAQVIQFRQEA
jgi:integrase